MKRVTGIGGVFFKCADPEAQRSWYRDHLGFTVDQYGSTFTWRTADAPHVEAATQWSPFAQSSKYFAPSAKEYMFNYRVENLTWLIDQLRTEGVEIVGEIQDSTFGKFAHVMDPEGNKIELWEPAPETEEKG